VRHRTREHVERILEEFQIGGILGACALGLGPDDLKRETFNYGRKSDQLITAYQVAALINISPKSIYRWAAEGRLPAFREGRVIRFLASDVETFIKSRIGAAPPAR